MTAAAEKAALAIVQDAAARHGATLDAVPARDRKHLRDRLLSLDGLADLPPVRPLIDGLLYKDTLAQLAGPPGSYKSFITVGMACAVAVGVNWEGHRVPEAGPVVYVAAEGASGLRVRILAWCEANKVPVERVARNLRVLREPLALADEQDVQEAVQVASESGALLTVLDTRARCTTGLEENSATEQGLAIAAAERIQRASGGAVSWCTTPDATASTGAGATAGTGRCGPTCGSRAPSGAAPSSARSTRTCRTDASTTSGCCLASSARTSCRPCTRSHPTTTLRVDPPS